jgi:CBS domain-containing protein
MGEKTIATILKAKGPEVHSVDPKTTAYEALAKMAASRIAAVLVMEQDDVRGIFSAKDYAARVVLQGRNGQQIPIEEVMTHPIVTVGPDTKVMDGMQIMTTKGLRHLPITEGGRIIGLVTLADLVRSILTDQEFKIEQLMTYIGT